MELSQPLYFADEALSVASYRRADPKLPHIPKAQLPVCTREQSFQIQAEEPTPGKPSSPFPGKLTFTQQDALRSWRVPHTWSPALRA
ncbi:hypothetical protein H920_06917 [Fukomys damarensis]|uniref:Uncharacterized protein n=1 Tax=Fukomys damarensis TaxID=885580 RepID=A0A091DMR2_FUKDA|nr:hypothetical protein H920_06917 [Fukomys damarensis]